MNDTDYVGWLQRRQRLEGWSDRRMAVELGVPSTVWHRITTGQRAPSVGFLRRAMRRFPEYDPWLLDYLRTGAQGGRHGEHATGPQSCAATR
jgi:hypothetical protein